MTPRTLRVGKVQASNLVLACCALLLAGCGAAGGAPVLTGAQSVAGHLTTKTTLREPQHTTHHSAASRVVGDLSKPVDYPQFDVRLDPPGQAVPSLPATDAVASCLNPEGGVACETGQPMSVALALVTDAGMGIQQRLMWVLSWKSVGCDVMGPGRASPGPFVNDVTGCDFVTFVDADTGANPMAIRGPGLVN